MKKNILLQLILTCIFLLTACNKDDDESPSGNTSQTDQGFALTFSQLWVDTAGNPKTYFFGPTDSLKRFTGTENDSSGTQNLLVGSTNNFQVNFTVIKNQFSGYVDYSGKFTDTSSANMRLVFYSLYDTLYLKPN